MRLILLVLAVPWVSCTHGDIDFAKLNIACEADDPATCPAGHTCVVGKCEPSGGSAGGGSGGVDGAANGGAADGGGADGAGAGAAAAGGGGDGGAAADGGGGDGGAAAGGGDGGAAAGGGDGDACMSTLNCMGEGGAPGDPLDADRVLDCTAASARDQLPALASLTACMMTCEGDGPSCAEGKCAVEFAACEQANQVRLQCPGLYFCTEFCQRRLDPGPCEALCRESTESEDHVVAYDLLAECKTQKCLDGRLLWDAFGCLMQKCGTKYRACFDSPPSCPQFCRDLNRACGVDQMPCESDCRAILGYTDQQTTIGCLNGDNPGQCPDEDTFSACLAEFGGPFPRDRFYDQPFDNPDEAWDGLSGGWAVDSIGDGVESVLKLTEGCGDDCPFGYSLARSPQRFWWDGWAHLSFRFQASTDGIPDGFVALHQNGRVGELPDNVLKRMFGVGWNATVGQESLSVYLEDFNVVLEVNLESNNVYRVVLDCRGSAGASLLVFQEQPAGQGADDGRHTSESLYFQEHIDAPCREGDGRAPVYLMVGGRGTGQWIDDVFLDRPPCHARAGGPLPEDCTLITHLPLDGDLVDVVRNVPAAGPDPQAGPDRQDNPDQAVVFASEDGGGYELPTYTRHRSPWWTIDAWLGGSSDQNATIWDDRRLSGGIVHGGRRMYLENQRLHCSYNGPDGDMVVAMSMPHAADHALRLDGAGWNYVACRLSPTGLHVFVGNEAGDSKLTGVANPDPDSGEHLPQYWPSGAPIHIGIDVEGAGGLGRPLDDLRVHDVWRRNEYFHQRLSGAL